MPAEGSLPVVRLAHREDAKMLAALAEKTFRDAFASVNTPEDMDLHCRNSYGEAIQAAEIASPGMLTLLCEIDGRAVGYAQLRRGHAPACVVAEAPGEVQRIYVESDCHGKGVAQALMDRCINETSHRGCDVIWLGVWERNPRAIAFYRKLGFREVGEHIFPLGNDPQRDIVMVRPLRGAEPV